MKLYLVGGSVRDHLLGVPSKDRDFMMEATFEQLQEFVTARGYTILHINPEFLTLRVRIPSKEVVDFACCRTEGEYDGRRPGVVELTNLEGDLSRRDFTINAMAIEVDHDFNPIGEVVDFFGGKKDLELKALKFVGDPKERLREDGLRWLRGLRFVITKGFHFTAETLYWMQNPPLGMLDKVSQDRIKDELNRCFVYDTKVTLGWLARLPTPWLKDKIWLKTTIEDKN